MIKGKILIKGTITNKSPLHIGSGSDNRSDMDVLLDSTNRPYIPATSLTGVLRHTIELSEDDQNHFWGYQADQQNGKQSVFRCSDLETKTFQIKIRDGIKINSQTGMIEKANKFDYEIIEPGAMFSFKMEMGYTNTDEQTIKKSAATIYHLLSEGLAIGAKTNSGLGDIQIMTDKTMLYDFQFTNKQHVYEWLTRQYTENTRIESSDLGKPLQTKSQWNFSIEADLQLKNTLIVRSYSDKPKMPDAIHMQSNQEWVLPGTSLKGAIRARAERIANMLGVPSIMDELFGYVKNQSDDNDSRQSAAKGRILIKETILPKFVAELQTRIKIDRFTGGTIQSALFNSMPVFADIKNNVVKLSIQIRHCKPPDVGLILLVLKDLWTQDLAVGGEKNIGRGVFQGLRATITWNSDLFILTDDLSQLSAGQKKLLQDCVDKLVLKDD